MDRLRGPCGQEIDETEKSAEKEDYWIEVLVPMRGDLSAMTPFDAAQALKPALHQEE